MTIALHSWFRPKLESDIGRRATRDIIAGLVLIALFFGGFGTWMAVAPIASAVIADGVVKVATARQQVQSTTGGTVKEMLVHDGDLVKAGQPLFIIHDERLDSQYAILRGVSDSERAKQARLEAEQSLADRIEFPEDLTARASDPQVSRILEREHTLFTARMGALKEQLALLRKQQGDTEQERKRSQERLQSQRDGRELLQRQLTLERSLVDKQYITQQRMLELERVEKQYSADLHETEAGLSRIQQKANDFALRELSLTNSLMENAAAELKNTNSRLMDIEQQLKPSQEATQRLTVTAPLDGTVFNIRIHTIGELVKMGDVLAEVVPAQSDRLIEALVPVKEIKHVAVGGKAEIRFTAYNQRITPQVEATVIYVAPDRTIDKDNPRDGYLVRLKLDPESLKLAGDLELIPGMSATVFVRAGDRTMLSYLGQPVMDSLARSFRETH